MRFFSIPKGLQTVKTNEIQNLIILYKNNKSKRLNIAIQLISTIKY